MTTKIKLPSHTTRYWARECYRLNLMTGRTRLAAKTVQGMQINCEMDIREYCIVITDADTGDTIKVEKIRKSWI